jgi:hypothetical protein
VSPTITEALKIQRRLGTATVYVTGVVKILTIKVIRVTVTQQTIATAETVSVRGLNDWELGRDNMHGTTAEPQEPLLPVESMANLPIRMVFPGSMITMSSQWKPT